MMSPAPLGGGTPPLAHAIAPQVLPQAEATPAPTPKATSAPSRLIPPSAPPPPKIKRREWGRVYFKRADGMNIPHDNICTMCHIPLDTYMAAGGSAGEYGMSPSPGFKKQE